MTGLHNHQAERAILGAILLTNTHLDAAAVDQGLRPNHLHDKQHQRIYAAMLSLRDRDEQIDPVTVSELLASDSEPLDIHHIEQFAADAPASGNARDHVRIVLQHATWRARQQATVEMQQAIVDRDQAAFDLAEARIATSDRPDESTSTPEELAADMFDWLASTDSDAIELPFPSLNRLLSGGLRRGDVTVVAGWSSMGKSIIADQILEHAASTGHSTHLYINEMSRRDRYARRLARHSRIPFSRILDRPDLTEQERAELVTAMRVVPDVPITDCSGWSGSDIARHIRRRRCDIAAVDLLNLIPHGGPERSRASQVDAISAALNSAARQADCHVLLVCQLNQERNKTARFPRPVRRDIRDSGQLANDAQNVMFVHRDQDEVDAPGGVEMFELLNEGSVWLDKARNGRLGGVQVKLEAARMSFVEVPRLVATGAMPAAGTGW